MDVPHYVNDDVRSGSLFYWTFYYTHRTDMDAPQYVHVDEPADYVW